MNRVSVKFMGGFPGRSKFLKKALEITYFKTFKTW